MRGHVLSGRKGTLIETGRLCLSIASELTFTTGVDHIQSGGAGTHVLCLKLMFGMPGCLHSHVLFVTFVLYSLAAAPA